MIPAPSDPTPETTGPRAAEPRVIAPHVIAQGADWREWSNGDVDYFPPRFGLPDEDAPPPLGRDYRADPVGQGGGHRPRPAVVWDAARRDYLAGDSGAQVCKRYGLKLATLRHRAAADGWRRADQPEPDPAEQAAFDDEADLDAYFDSDDAAMAELCRARMARAVYQGDAAAAHRWRRLSELLWAEARDLNAFIAEAEARDAAHPAPARTPAGAPDGGLDCSDGSDSVFSSGDRARPHLPPSPNGGIFHASAQLREDAMGDQITTGASEEAVEKYAEGLEAIEKWQAEPEQSTPEETGSREFTEEESGDRDAFLQLHGRNERGGPRRLEADLDSADAMSGVIKTPE